MRRTVILLLTMGGVSGAALLIAAVSVIPFWICGKLSEWAEIELVEKMYFPLTRFLSKMIQQFFVGGMYLFLTVIIEGLFFFVAFGIIAGAVWLTLV